MELDLNELERRAKSAGGQEWTLTIDATGDAFLSAENSEYVAEVGAVGEDGIVSDYGKFIAAANPAVVLELVRRLRAAEIRLHDVATLCANVESELAEIKRRTYVAVTCNHVGRMERAEARVAELEAERAEREKQEPVAYLTADKNMLVFADKCVDMKHLMTPLYADPPVTAPVRLTDEGIANIVWAGLANAHTFARAIEAASLRSNGFDIQPPEAGG